jgi:hypothetical protein
VPKEQLSTRIAAAVCDGIAPCCQSQGFAYDPARCKSTLTTLYEEELVQDANLPGVNYDANAAGVCLEWIQSVVRSCYATEAPAECDRMFVGSLAPGSACQSSIQCLAPPGGEADCMNGVCQQEPRAKLGEPCAMTCTDVSGDTSCQFFGTGSGASCYTNDGLQCQDGTCQPLRAIGEACAPSGCVATAYCADGVCAAKEPIGGSCSIGYEEESCSAGYCAADGICTAKKANGAACQSNEECQVECEQGSCVPGEPIADAEVCSGAIN